MIYTPTKNFPDPQMQRINLWVADMMGASVDQAAELRITPEAIVAQAALESSWGRLAIGHNIFGIKAGPAWHGPILMQRTAEERDDGSVFFIEAAFRDYPTYKACIDDRLVVLRGNPAFAAAGVFSARDDASYFAALKAGGYATDIDYVAKLLKMVESVRIFSGSMAVSATAPAIAEGPPTPRILLAGMRGPDVETLQTALATAHFFFSMIDGDYGPKTVDAVKALQRAKHLAVDGIAGAETRAALGL